MFNTYLRFAMCGIAFLLCHQRASAQEGLKPRKNNKSVFENAPLDDLVRPGGGQLGGAENDNYTVDFSHSKLSVPAGELRLIPEFAVRLSAWLNKLPPSTPQLTLVPVSKEIFPELQTYSAYSLAIVVNLGPQAPTSMADEQLEAFSHYELSTIEGTQYVAVVQLPVSDSCILSGFPSRPANTAQFAPYIEAAALDEPDPHPEDEAAIEEDQLTDLAWAHLFNARGADETGGYPSRLHHIVALYPGSTAAAAAANFIVFDAKSRVDAFQNDASDPASRDKRAALLFDRIGLYRPHLLGTAYDLLLERYSYELSRSLDESSFYVSFIDRFPASTMLPLVQNAIYVRDLKDIVLKVQPPTQPSDEAPSDGTEPLESEGPPVFPSQCGLNLCNSYLKNYPNSPQWPLVAQIASSVRTGLQHPSADREAREAEARVLSGEALGYYRTLHKLRRVRNPESGVSDRVSGYHASDRSTAQETFAQIDILADLLMAKYPETVANHEFFDSQTLISQLSQLEAVETEIYELRLASAAQNDRLITTIETEFDATRRAFVIAMEKQTAELKEELSTGFSEVKNGLGRLHDDLGRLNATATSILSTTNSINQGINTLNSTLKDTNKAIDELGKKVDRTTEAVEKVALKVEQTNAELGKLRRDMRRNQIPGVGAINKAGGDISRESKRFGGQVKKLSKKLFGMLNALLADRIVVYDFRTDGLIAVNCTTGDVTANFYFPGGDVSLSDVIAGRNEIPNIDVMSALDICLMGQVKVNNDLQDVRARMRSDNPDALIYFASPVFLEKVSVEQVVDEVAGAIITGGTTTEDSVQDYADVLLAEARSIAAWMQAVLKEESLSGAELEKVVSDLGNALVQQRSVTLPAGIKFRWIPVTYYYTIRFPGISDALEVVLKAIGFSPKRAALASHLSFGLPHGYFAVLVPKQKTSLPTSSERELLAKRIRELSEESPSTSAMMESLSLSMQEIGLPTSLFDAAEIQDSQQTALKWMSSKGLDVASALDAADDADVTGAGPRSYEVDLRSTPLAGKISNSLKFLGLGNEGAVGLSEFSLDLSTGVITLRISCRHRHAWKSLSDLPAEARSVVNSWL